MTSRYWLYWLSFHAASVMAMIPDRACVTHQKPGDLILGGIFPVYRSGAIPCDGILNHNGVRMVESMVYAIEAVNNRSYILPNVTIGYEIRNDCLRERV